MKKKISIILCVIFVMTLIAACAGGDGSYPAPAESMWYGNDSIELNAVAPAAPQAAPMPDMMVMSEAEYVAYDDSDMGRSGSLHEAGGAGITSVTAPVTDGFSEKIIYSVFAELETMRFDETIAGVHTLMANYGAFIESSSIGGVSSASKFYGWNEYRSAYFSIRVPKERLDAMTSSLDNLGNVTHINSNATNITSQFFDTQSRLNSLIIQEDRLLDMLAKAEDVPDLIMIEERLSDVRYQVESLTTTLNNWQNQVDYSTLTLSINEVEQFTERVEIHRSYWQQIGDGFLSTIRGIGRFFMNLFMWLIISAPVLIILAVVGVAALIIVRWKLRSIAKKKAENQNNQQS